jgi:hypothetical protein
MSVTLRARVQTVVTRRARSHELTHMAIVCDVIPDIVPDITYRLFGQSDVSTMTDR